MSVFEGQEILSVSIKEELLDYGIVTACYYEGCGSDDGWPEAVFK